MHKSASGSRVRYLRSPLWTLVMAAVCIASIASAAVTPAAAITLQTSDSEQAACSLTPLGLPLFNATPAAALVATTTASPVHETTRKPTAEEASDLQSGIGVIVACLNTGDPLQVYAVFTERYLATEYADPTRAYQPAFEQLLAGPTVPVDPPFTLVTVTDITMSGSDRAQATVTLTQLNLTWSDTLVLVQAHGDWLIDDIAS